MSMFAARAGVYVLVCCCCLLSLSRRSLTAGGWPWCWGFFGVFQNNFRWLHIFGFGG